MKKKIIISVVIVLVVAIAVIVGYILTNGKNSGNNVVEEKEKNIMIEVTNSKMETKTYNVVTKSKYVKDALNEAAGLTVEYIESEEGSTISGVNGEVLDLSNQFWSFTLNDDFCEKTVDKQEIKDGDKIAIYFSTM